MIPERAVSPGRKPTAAGVSMSSRSKASAGGALTISARPKRKRGPTWTSITTGTGAAKSASRPASATSTPAARMLIAGP